MKKLLLFLSVIISVSLVSTPPLLAIDTVYLRSLTGHSCQITGATNATPIVITFSSGCSFAIGDVVILYHVRGNYAANGVRKVKNDGNYSSTTFALTDISNVNIAGSGGFTATAAGQVGGNYALQAYVAPATLFTLNSHPRGVFSSAILSSMTGNVANTRGDNNGISYKAITDIYNNWSTNYVNLTDSNGTGQKMTIFATSALKWYADGSPGSGTEYNVPLWLMQNPTLPSVGGSTACDETASFCGTNAQITDYVSTNAQNILWTYELLQSTMTTGQKQLVADFMLNDNDVLNYGVNNSGSGCAKQATTGGPGTITITGGAAGNTGQTLTVVGVGTNFGSGGGPHVGDVIFTGTAPNQGFNDAIIASITNTTHMTLFLGAGGTSRDVVGSVWLWVPQWSQGAGNCGLVWFTKHHNSSNFADPITYPTRGGETYDIGNNSAMRFANIYLQTGLAFCGFDARGCLLASMASGYMYDQVQSFAFQSLGKMPSGDAYNRAVTYWLYDTYVATMLNSVSGGTYNLVGLNQKDDLYEYIYDNVPWVNNTPLHYGAPGNAGFWDTGGGFRGGFMKSYFWPSDAPYFYYWLDHNQGWLTEANLARFDGLYTPWEYIFYDPSVGEANYTTLTNQYLTTNRDTAKCTAGGFFCSQYNVPTNDIISRTGLSGSSDTVLYLNSQSVDAYMVETDGHGLFGCPVCIGISKNIYLMGGDQGGGGNPPVTNIEPTWNYYANLVEVGSSSPIVPASTYSQFSSAICDFTTASQNVLIPRYAGTVPTGVNNSNYFYALTDVIGSYCASVSLTRAHRHFAHMKKAGLQDYIVEYVDYAAGGGGTSFGERYQLFLNGVAEGTAVSGTYGNNGGAFINLQTAASAKLLVSVLPITTNTVLTTHYGTAGGQGGTSLVYACAENSGAVGSCDSSAHAATWINVYKPSVNVSDTMPVLSQPTVSNFDTVVIQDTGGSAKVVSFAKAGALQASWSGTTSFSGTAQYLIAGLTPGTYTMAVNGTPICTGVTVATNDNTFYCEAGAGTVVVNTSGPVCTITTASLPNGTLSSIYSQTLATVSCTPPINWSITAGTLCGGLALGTTTGAIGGFPNMVQTCSFTVQAVDSLSAIATQPLSITINTPNGQGVTGSASSLNSNSKGSVVH